MAVAAAITSPSDKLATLMGARDAVAITVNTADRARCRGVYVGNTDSYDFSFDGSAWVNFPNCQAGSVLQLHAVGARHNSGSTAPDAGDINFLY